MKMKVLRFGRKPVVLSVFLATCVVTLLPFELRSRHVVLMRSTDMGLIDETDAHKSNSSTNVSFVGAVLELSDLLALENKSVSSYYCLPCPKKTNTKMAVLNSTSDLSAIQCSVNGAYTIGCVKERDEVFMPATFIKKYFEVYGDKKKVKGKELFELNYSYGKVNAPTPVYEPGGAFLNFKYYHVEVRKLLQCVTASEGVPLAVQWNPDGYFYAIAVAQFGLSHHAKGVVDGNPEPKVLSSGERGTKGWKLPHNVKGCSVSTVVDEVKGIERTVVAFSAPESMTAKGPIMTLNSADLVLCVSVKMLGPGGITVKVKTIDGQSAYVHFTLDDFYMKVKGKHTTLGMRQRNMGQWMRLTRDLDIDVGKAVDKIKQVFQIVSVTLHGKGYIDNMTIGPSAHNENLMHAADWLLAHQDKKGGWPTSTAMHTAQIKLAQGWYSAMGQGQAMSALVRAYNLTEDRKYLASAERALHLYTLGSEEGGVRARFMGQLDWYEEYPTVPTSSFVLNGFIFSMMGLYDVMKTSQGKPKQLAEKLWNSGMRSLKFMLGMYDSGAGTLYDLRHVINHEAPNRARWDYHRTHIALIHQLAIVDGDPVFWQTWERWKGYLKGVRSRLSREDGHIPL